MATLEEMALAALRRDHLVLRSLAHDFLRDHPRLANVPQPQTNRAEVLAVAAGLIELLANRVGQAAPNWTRAVGPLAEPFLLLESALRMKRLRTLCETESPEPLRKRKLYAPPDFLTFA